MVVVDMLDRSLDSLSEALMHKMHKINKHSLSAGAYSHENFVWGPRAGIININ